MALQARKVSGPFEKRAPGQSLESYDLRRYSTFTGPTQTMNNNQLQMTE